MWPVKKKDLFAALMHPFKSSQVWIFHPFSLSIHKYYSQAISPGYQLQRKSVTRLLVKEKLVDLCRTHGQFSFSKAAMTNFWTRLLVKGKLVNLFRIHEQFSFSKTTMISFWTRLFVNEKLVNLCRSYTRTNKTCQKKTCQGKLGLVYLRLKFLKHLRKFEKTRNYRNLLFLRCSFAH